MGQHPGNPTQGCPPLTTHLEAMASPIDEFESEGKQFGCGILKFDSLKFFLKPAWALVFLCMLIVGQGMAVTGFLGIVKSAIERRYRLSSTNSGTISSCYEMAYCVGAIFVSYVGRKNKPYWIGMGALLIAIGCFLFTLPQYLAPSYVPSATGSIGICSNSSISSKNIECQGTASSYLVLFCFAYVLIGIGSSPIYTLGTVYLDENTKRGQSGLFLAIMHLAAAIGPAVGFILGKPFLSLYVDIVQPKDSHLTPDDDRWVGAWWPGYLVSVFIVTMSCLPVLGLPKELPGKAVVQANKSAMVDCVRDEHVRPAKNFQQQVRSILCNRTFMLVVAAITVEGCSTSGYAAFMPKFFEYQYQLTQSDASLYSGLVLVPGVGGGILAGGLLLKLSKWSCPKILRTCTVISSLGLVSVALLLVGCSGRKFVGVSMPYLNSITKNASTYSLDSPCNTECACSPADYKPVCLMDKHVTYYSPCYAGCKVSVDDMKFTNCSCLPGPTEVLELGSCLSSCSKRSAAMVGQFVMMVLIFFTNMPLLDVMLRSLPASQSSLGMGIQQFIVRLFGFITGPLIFGAVIDYTCMLWHNTCGSGNCLQYDSEKFRLYLFVLCAALKLVSLVLLWIADLTYKLPGCAVNTGPEIQDENQSRGTELKPAASDDMTK